jgi:ferredoxin
MQVWIRESAKAIEFRLFILIEESIVFPVGHHDHCGLCARHCPYEALVQGKKKGAGCSHPEKGISGCELFNTSRFNLPNPDQPEPRFGYTKHVEKYLNWSGSKTCSLINSIHFA